LISRIFIDDKNDVWICTDREGVYRLNSSNGTIEDHFTSKNPAGKKILINGASDIIQYNDSIFVIASEGLNILNRYTNKIIYFTRENGLISTNISNLVKDKNGYIWMTTTAGIMSYHPFKNKLSLYNALDGVHTTSFTVGASGVLNDGRICFGTNHDVIVFDPSRVTVEDYIPPKVQVAAFSLMNKPLPVDSLLNLKVITLKHFEHSITIELTTLTYQNIYPLYYKMEGLDADWVKGGKINQATYNYLRPGKYIFKTACKNADGKMGEVTSLEINILPPFWKTWWFFSLIALLVIFLIYIFDRQRIRRNRREQLIRSGIAANLQEEVNTSLQNINVLSEIASMKANVHPEQSKNYIHEIKQKSRHMVIAMNEVLWSIDPANDTMGKTIDRIHEYSQALMNSCNSAISFQVDPEVKKLYLDMRRRHEFMIIYKLGITSMTQVLKCQQCSIQLDYVKNIFTLKLFSNVPINTTNTTVIKNINEMKRRAANINATIDIQKVGEGGYIKVALKM
ncbi:MAG TPA: triple tyrosine motif-containing protein, partial [Ferruginibacter sp.]|nr:triple tyrosine motif-containing protein [Ferruginibacter sp.]